MSKRFLLFLIPSLALAGSAVLYDKVLINKHEDLMNNSFYEKANKLTAKNYEKYFKKFDKIEYTSTHEYRGEIYRSEDAISKILKYAKSPRGKKKSKNAYSTNNFKVDIEQAMDDYVYSYDYFTKNEFEFIDKDYYLDKMMVYPCISSLFGSPDDVRSRIEIINEEGSKMLIDTHSPDGTGFGPFTSRADFFKITFKLRNNSAANIFGSLYSDLSLDSYTVKCKNKYKSNLRCFKEFYVYKLLDKGGQLKRKHKIEVKSKAPYEFEVIKGGKTHTFNLLSADISYKN